MCGRYRRRSDKQRIAEAFEAGMGLEDLYLDPSEDVAPGSMQPVVYLHESGERAIAPMRWGFKTPDRLLFNTRSETVTTANFWKDSFLKRRCLVPVDGFYEWMKGAGRGKTKFVFTVPGRELFGLAGVWSSWKNPKTGEREPTFSILTGEANGVMRPIHDRQPIIAERRDYREWLVMSERPPVHLLRLLPDDELQSARAEIGVENAEQQGLFQQENLR
jgi:putative SOS response-associated peptidase YedK